MTGERIVKTVSVSNDTSSFAEMENTEEFDECLLSMHQSLEEMDGKATPTLNKTASASKAL